jgi:hypothetical protein
MNAPVVQQSWDAATFEGNEREQLQRWARMSFTEKLRWLEEADRLSRKFEAARQKLNGGAQLPAGGKK